MIVVFLFELGVTLFVLWFITTQLVIPVLNSRPLFPMLRKSEVSIKDELVEVNQVLHEQDLRKELESKKVLVETKPTIVDEVASVVEVEVPETKE